MIKELTVSANRRQVYDLLLAECNNDTRFCIQTPKTDNDWGALTVASMRAARLLDGHIRGAVFGTVRLLDLGERTAVQFVDKDAMYRVSPNDYGKRLFREFAELAEARFIRHKILDSGAPEQPAEAGKGEASPGRPRYEADDWAWRQVNEEHRNRNEVYSEWVDKITPQRRQDLADLRDSFNKAVRPDRGKKKEKTE